VVGEDLEQQQVAELGVLKLRVVQALSGLVDRFGVDALPGLRVVLDLDGQVAVSGLDEDLVQYIDVGKFAGDLVLAGGGTPLEVMGGGEDVVPFPAVVDVCGVPVGVNVPAEDPLVLDTAASLKDGQQS